MVTMFPLWTHLHDFSLYACFILEMPWKLPPGTFTIVIWVLHYMRLIHFPRWKGSNPLLTDCYHSNICVTLKGVLETERGLKNISN